MPRINMLPRDLKSGLAGRRTLRFFFISLLILLFLIYCSFAYHYFYMQRELNKVNKELKIMTPRFQEFKKLQQQGNEIDARLTGLNNLIRQRKKWSPVLAGIKSVIPGDIQLTRLKIHSRNNIEKDRENTAAQAKSNYPNAVTLEGGSQSVPSIGVLLKRLNALEYFNRVELNKLQGEKNIEFSITAHVEKIKEVPENEN
ncbi:MAG: PilN domain-containing protein [Clostridiales bacterium]|nr:PilN domain-containing protein [Clostridiales bacterium]MCF8021157.1 PilN domain-containing protein [Clostridiales bacterium]